VTLGGRTPATRALLRGAAKRSFDGNRTDDLRHWMFADSDFLSDDTIEALMDLTAEGNLSWVCVPPEGYRV
jgi:hypothetical protein